MENDIKDRINFHREIHRKIISAGRAFPKLAHEEWRKNYDSTGTIAKMKLTQDGTETNINVPFENLHKEWVRDNIESFKAARRAYMIFYRIPHRTEEESIRMLEMAGKMIYEEKIRRRFRLNKSSNDSMNYDLLSEEEKEKNRLHIKILKKLLDEQPN